MRVDQQFMARAIDCAKRGRYSTHPNPQVGCVIVKNGECVAEGAHLSAGGPHAEVHALAMAQAQSQGACVYVTLEPCAHQGRTGPCVDALIQANVARVVIGQIDPNPRVQGLGIALLRKAGIEVVVGVLEAECRALNRGFNSQFERRRPWVQLKSAMSLDARIALANGQSQWITGEAARADVQAYRAAASAIVSTATTVIHDQARLTVRGYDEPLRKRMPLRIVVDTALKLSKSDRLFQESGPIWIVTTETDPTRWAHLLSEQVDVVSLPANPQGTGVDIQALMDHCISQSIHTLWVEAGARFAESLITQEWIDEWIIYVNPRLLGADGVPLWSGLGPTAMGESVRFKLSQTRQLGDDLRLTLVPLKQRSTL